MKDNQFGCRKNFESSEGKTVLYSLEKLQKDGKRLHVSANSKKDGLGEG